MVLDVLQSKQFLKRYLTYFNLLIKLEGLDSAVLENFCQFVVSASRMMNLEVTKKYVDRHFSTL